MTKNFTAWIEDILTEIKQNPTPENIKLLESCGKGCAVRNKMLDGIKNLKGLASNCKTKTDYVKFLNEHIPAKFVEVEDGIIMYLQKIKCSCPMVPAVSKNADMLCNCTNGNNKVVWSEFFGKPVETEIVESFLRGGKDCVIKFKV